MCKTWLWHVLHTSSAFYLTRKLTEITTNQCPLAKDRYENHKQVRASKIYWNRTVVTKTEKSAKL